MDEDHMSEDENPKDNDNLNNRKRIKVLHDLLNEESASNNTEENTAGTSATNEETPKVRANFRNRNYRNSHMEEETDSNTSEENSPINFNGDSSDSSVRFSPRASSRRTSSTFEDEELSDSVSLPSGSGLREVDSVLKKTKPKHTWLVVPSVMNRQFGLSSKYGPANLFRNRCYGSLHSVQRLELMYQLKEHEGCVNCLNFSPDGSLLASGSDDLQVVIWDWKVGRRLLKFNSKHQTNVFQTKFMYLCGDLHIATCSRDGQVRLARLSREGGVREQRRLGFHEAACHKLAVLKDQPHLVLSAGEDGEVQSHDVRTLDSNVILTVKKNNRKIPLFSIHGHPLRTNEYCVAGQCNSVLVYDQRKNSKELSSYCPMKESSARNLHITSAVYNYDGREILASYNEEDIYLFDANSSEQGVYLHRYEGHRNCATIKGVNFFGPHSEFVVSGSDCGNIFYWEKNTEAIVQFMAGDDSGVVNCLEPHPSVPYICTSGLDWDVKVWVPSCEHEPTLEGLSRTMLKNKQTRRDPDFGLESRPPILWMLWQHLRDSGRRAREESNDDLSSDLSDSGIPVNDLVPDDSDEDVPINLSGDCATS